ncbi:hypothetical protein S83_070086 [Arachis hypogaea]
MRVSEVMLTYEICHHHKRCRCCWPPIVLLRFASKLASSITSLTSRSIIRYSVISSRNYTSKDINFGVGAPAAILQGATKVADAVKVTMGPKGRNTSSFHSSESNNGHKVKIGVGVGVSVGILCGLLLAFCLIWKRRKRATLKETNAALKDQSKEEQEEDPEVPLYDLSIIASSTDNFSHKNKLGEGGFGLVFQPIDKQSLLDSGIFCCLIHVLNGLLNPDVTSQ